MCLALLNKPYPWHFWRYFLASPAGVGVEGPLVWALRHDTRLDWLGFVVFFKISMVLNISRVSFDQHYRVLYNGLSLSLFQPTTATGSGSASGKPPTVRLTPSSHRMSIPSGSGWRPSGSNPSVVINKLLNWLRLSMAVCMSSKQAHIVCLWYTKILIVTLENKDHLKLKFELQAFSRLGWV